MKKFERIVYKYSDATQSRLKLQERKTSNLLKNISQLWDAKGYIKKINSSENIIALLSLLSEAPLEAESLIEQRIKKLNLYRELIEYLPKLSDEIIIEKAICLLYSADKESISLLLEQFPNLNNFAKSIICVLFGMLKFNEAEEIILEFFYATASLRKLYKVGALWGLADINYEKMADLLLYLHTLPRRDYFLELYGFIAIYGDERILSYLLQRLKNLKSSKITQDIIYTLGYLFKRIGKEILAPHSKYLKYDIVLKPTASALSLVDEQLDYYQMYHPNGEKYL